MSHDSPPAISYKTIGLSKGRHSSPAEGACVMELASMIAGEPFSDHPRTVCPVIAALLRAYNDSLDDRRRQDLYSVAAQVVGTRATFEIERQRIERCVAWTGEMRAAHNRVTRALRRRPRPTKRLNVAEVTAQRAVTAIRRHTPATHAAMTSLVDDLCAMGRRDDTTDSLVSGFAHVPGFRAPDYAA